MTFRYSSSCLTAVFRIAAITSALLSTIAILIPYASYSQDLGNLKNEKPFTVKGNLGASCLVYGHSGNPANSSPFSWMLNGNINARLYGVDLPFSFVLSERDRSYRQPFNQFGLSPKYKWFTAHLGYRNINYSTYTLGGHTIWGAGFEANPGKIRVAFMYGRFNRAAGYTSGLINSTPAYKRNGFSARIGYGDKKSYFDLILLKARDDSSSLRPDTQRPQVTPAANLVAGYNTRLQLNKFFSFESEAAWSFYTANFRDDSLTETASKNAGLVNGIIPVNSSTEDHSAIRAGFSYRQKAFSLKLQYKRIAPNFRSMGTYYLNNDIQDISLEPGLQLSKQKLNLRGAIGLQQDNLSKARKATSTRLAGSFNMNWNPSPKFGLDAGYTNFSTNQKAGNLPLPDSSKIYLSNGSLTISPRIMLAGKKYNHIVSILYNYLLLNDKNEKTSQFTEFTTQNIMLNYAFNIPANSLTANLGILYTGFESNNFSQNNYGFNAGISQSLLKNNLNISLPFNVVISERDTIKSSIINIMPSASYRLGNHHLFSLQAAYIGNFAEAGNDGTYNEFKLEIGYRYNF